MLYGFFARNTNLHKVCQLHGHGGIFRIFQNFATRLFSLTNFGMLFSALPINFPSFKFILKGNGSFKVHFNFLFINQWRRVGVKYVYLKEMLISNANLINADFYFLPVRLKHPVQHCISSAVSTFFMKHAYWTVSKRIYLKKF